MPIVLTLKNLQANDPPREITFDEGPITVGRTTANHVVLDDTTKAVSARHARIDGEGAKFQVTDLKSTNGTYLNDEPLRAKQAYDLSPGDRLTMGPWQVVCAITAPERRAPPPPPKFTTQVTVQEVDALESGKALLGRLVDVPVEKVAETLQAELAQIPSHQVLAVLDATLISVAGCDQPVNVREPLAELIATEKDRQMALREAALLEFQALSKQFVGKSLLSDPGHIALFRELMAQTLDQTLEWIWSCLSGRREFSSSFGASVTQMFSLAGNPIKMALDSEQIGYYLLNWAGTNPPNELGDNLADAFRDLTAHQLAIVKGVEAATKAAFELLDPRKVEEEAAREAKGPFRNIGAQSRAWQTFKRTYEDLTDNESKLFNEVIHPTLKKAYLKAHDEQGIVQHRSGR